MSNLLVCSADLLSAHNFWVALGQVVVIAMIIGAFLDESWKKLRNWMIAGVLFAIIEQYIRTSFRSSAGFDKAFLCESNAISLMVATTYTFGLATGWVIVYAGRAYSRRKYNKQIEEKENGK